MRLSSRLVLTAAALAVPHGAVASGGGGGGGDAPNLVPMEEIVVPVIESDRITGSLRVKLVVEAPDATAAATVNAEMPKLRAASVGAALEFARLNVSGLRAVDARRLAQELDAALRAADPHAGRVLVVEVAAARS